MSRRLIQNVLALFIFITSSNYVLGQTVTGSVKDKSGPLPGASVVVKGTTMGTQTDFDGNYTVEDVTADAVLVFSYIGYRTQEVLIGGQTNIDVVLEDDAQSLDEVVVVGYGTQKKSNLTGAVSIVKTEEIEKAHVANASNAIVGRTPGVVAKQASGEPGKDGSNIYIRGVATYQGNTTPGIIIDGIERNMSDFSQLDPNEIESVNVLKDAASAAIFGMRGANGVIVIKTKRGKVGKLSAKFSSNFGFQSPTQLPEFTNSYEYATLANEREKLMNPTSTTPRFTDEEIQKFKDGSDPDRYPNTDWYNLILENDFALQQQHNLSMSGGGEMVKYFTSLGYLDQGGLYDALNFDRYNLRTNVDIDFSKNTTFSVDISGRMEETKESNTSSQAVFAESLRNASIMPAVFSNGNLASPFGGHNNTYAAIKDGGYANTENNSILTRLQLEQQLPWIPGLSVKGVVSLDKNYYKRETWSSDPQTYSIEANGEYIKSPRQKPQLNLTQNESEFLETQLAFNYNRIFGDHSISGLAMFFQKETNVSYSNIRAFDFSSEVLQQINAAAQNVSTGNTDQFGRQSYIGRLNYSYKQRYLFEANVRRDGTENFAPDYRWGTFSSFSGAWILSEENFFENVKGIDFLKIRGSYGTLGNDQINTDRFPYYNKYNLYTAKNWLNSKLNYGDYIFDGSYVKGYEPGALGNESITWETSTKSNIGLDAKLFRDIDFTFDYFTEKRSDILTQRSASVPLHFGATLPLENIGEVENKGFEVALGYTKRLEELTFYLNGNFTYAKNKIINMDEAEGTSEFLRREGRPIDAYYGYKALGIFKTQAEIDGFAAQELQGEGYQTKPGDVKYADVNGDGKVDAGDRTYLGEGNVPNIIYGFSGGLDYKNFDFSFMFQGAADVQYQLQSQIVWPFFNDGGVPQFWADNHWSASNPNAQYSNIDVNNHNFPTDATSSLYVYDASYLRLKNIELGFSFPQEVVSQLNLTNVRIYLGGQNLLTFSDVPQVDPETINSMGQTYPNIKSYNFGIKIDF
ncbi:SusC/RagA family TonB-linked outer membrane protein [Zobellia galactanivorans]|uniref:TonB-dependent Receptor n=1 Tax=Zobellia galactanivorans (strain DSM 12802 / CCUG 47099 / CIP 106680 / NCIMB 13871 / Dsij) TaxID=63186 RepID=G0L2B7_ZOBGA|nr:TonB-dependent receptor [Zobellia galactanivorans]CAZ98031.1 TonB-dependent Receptor [Zobellia galactanivorans]